MSAHLPMHSLQILNPSELMRRKTCEAGLPQKEQLPPLLIGWLPLLALKLPKLIWSSSVNCSQCTLKLGVCVTGELLSMLPNGDDEVLVLIGQIKDGLIAPEGLNDCFDCVQDLRHTGWLYDVL
jgi:hypothetical protein